MSKSDVTPELVRRLGDREHHSLFYSFFQSKLTKHLQGRHNQLTHGRGGGGGGAKRQPGKILATNPNHDGEPGNSYAKEWADQAKGGTDEQKLAAKLLTKTKYLEGTRVLVDENGHPQAMYNVQTAGKGKPFGGKHRAIKDVDGDYVEIQAVATAPDNLKSGGQKGWGTAAMESALKDAKSAGARYVTSYAQSPGGEHLLKKHGFQRGHKKKPYYYLELKKQKQFLLPQDLRKAPTTSISLLPLAFDANDPRWKNEMVDRLLPEMARSMLEAMHAQMIEAGVDPTKTKHLQGWHNQLTHGRGVGRRRISDHPGMVPAKRAGKKWVLENGKPLPKHVGYVPPKWKNVKVSTDPKDDVLVTGFDEKGRSQAKYSASHNMKAAAAKFAKTAELRKKQDALRKEINKDIKNPKLKERAACMRLIQATGLRPGSTRDTLADKKAYGATTLEGRHVRTVRGKVHLKFTGKKGVNIDILVDDPVVARDLLRRKQAAGSKGQLFDASAGQVLSYAKTKDGGDFKTKDFRTAKGTTTAIKKIKSMPKPANEKEYKKAVNDVAKQVSKVLGNTPKVALQAYIDPTVFSGWRNSAGI